MRPNYIRKLAGMHIGLSVSQSSDSDGLGFNSQEVNRAVREISLAVLSQGGRLVFGHDWRSDGVMAYLFSFALEYQMPNLDNTEADAMIRNYVPWPSKSSISRGERSRFQDIIDIREIRPPNVSWSMTETPARRAASLTHMREELVKSTDARIAIGGRISGSGGRTSGVLEEVYLTMQANKPVFLSGLFGGATQQIINVIQGKRQGDLSAFRTRQDVAMALGTSAQSNGFGIDPERFNAYPLERIARTNGLSPQENKLLFEATHLNQVIGYTLTGLSRLKEQRAGKEVAREN